MAWTSWHAQGIYWVVGKIDDIQIGKDIECKFDDIVMFVSLQIRSVAV